MSAITPPRQNASATPLIVAVTGHRDLVPSELDGIRARVRELLSSLLKDFPERKLRIMSALAEGADQLVAELALDQGIDVIVPLPMRKDA
jgi:hypothetical protein